MLRDAKLQHSGNVSFFFSLFRVGFFSSVAYPMVASLTGLGITIHG